MGLLTILFALVPILASSDDSSSAAAAPLLLLLSGFVFYFLMYSRYRNADKRHSHESETMTEVVNLAAGDTLLQHKKGLSNAKMKGANHTRIEGSISGKDNTKGLIDAAKGIIS